MVRPTTRSSFTSTIWNSPRKALRSTNSAKFGGPNVNLTEGSKVRFNDGAITWNIDRIFEDGTLHLSAMSSGVKRTRTVAPSSPSWTNLWMVDGKRVGLGETVTAPPKPTGGGPDKTLDPGNVVIIGNSTVRWTVESVLRDGTVKLYTVHGDKLTYTSVGPMSKYWYSLYTANG